MYDITSTVTEMKDRVNFNRSIAREKNSFQRTEGTSFKETLKKAAVENRESVKSDSRPIDKKLMDTCIEMESLFVNKMLKEMRKTIHKNDWLHGGFAEEIFEDMLYDKYSLEVSKKANLGLAKQLYTEMSKI